MVSAHAQSFTFFGLYCNVHRFSSLQQEEVARVDVVFLCVRNSRSQILSSSTISENLRKLVNYSIVRDDKFVGFESPKNQRPKIS